MALHVNILYSSDARKDLLKIEKQTARRIVLKIEDSAKQKDPLTRAKALSGGLSGLYRYRIGDYRVIFSTDGKKRIAILKILRIKHRKDVYKGL